MIVALADLADSQPTLAGRLKAAAIQLLPPLLEGLHARRLAGQPDRGESAEHLQQWSLSNYWVSTNTLHTNDQCVGLSDKACASASAYESFCLHCARWHLNYADIWSLHLLWLHLLNTSVRMGAAILQGLLHQHLIHGL